MDSKTGKFVLVCLLFLAGLLLFQHIRRYRPHPANVGQTQKIVSMSPSLTEILFEMGLGNNLVGVTNYCVYPPETAQIEKIGDFVNPNFERILDLRPDLIFAERWSSSRIVSRLRNAGLKVVEIQSPRSIDEIYQTILAVGQEVSQEEKAREMTRDMRLRIQKIQAQAGHDGATTYALRGNRCAELDCWWRQLHERSHFTLWSAQYFRGRPKVSASSFS